MKELQKLQKLQKLQENLIQKKSPIFDEVSNNKSDISMKNNMNLLIGTVHDLINVIELRINLNEKETKCIEKIKDNINEMNL